MSQNSEKTSLPEAETLYSGKFIILKRRGTWEYASRPRNMGAAVIIALDGDSVILVEQQRIPFGKNTIELPAGLIGDSDSNESVETAAARELIEETGYQADSIDSLGQFAASPGMTSESFFLVRARNLKKISDGGGVDDEDITVHRVKLSELQRFLEQKRQEGFVIDSKLLLLLGPVFLGLSVFE
ncbi:ADP-ribose pyrophosphatase [Zymomonas mobilis]|uniref:GDP-mannose pyrophosphatase n=1 Tax=Zymomonas mobilis TaxID=542 RepID=A0A542W1H0_ZYMMB|nr:NUDIX hydrolase [Zymomonas mobilis]TQL17435.1 ADP-ribose pyrophosphatase [Zymomonas mobilis]